MEFENVLQWLQEGGDWDSAELLSQCNFSWDFIDLSMPLNGGSDIEILELDIQAPRRILEKQTTDYRRHVKAIEDAVTECSHSFHIFVRAIHWVPKTGAGSSSPSDLENEVALASLDSDQVKLVWAKALQRRSIDPAGAITSATTLVDSVCKRILADVGYPPNTDMNEIYHLACAHLRISPSQYADTNMKRILGNCEAVVSGIALIRNKLGDAHSHGEGEAKPTAAIAELAVNLAGTVATFMARTWNEERASHEKKQKTES